MVSAYNIIFLLLLFSFLLKSDLVLGLMHSRNNATW